MCKVLSWQPWYIKIMEILNLIFLILFLNLPHEILTFYHLHLFIQLNSQSSTLLELYKLKNLYIRTNQILEQTKITKKHNFCEIEFIIINKWSNFKKNNNSSPNTNSQRKVSTHSPSLCCPLTLQNCQNLLPKLNPLPNIKNQTLPARPVCD